MTKLIKVILAAVVLSTLGLTVVFGSTELPDEEPINNGRFYRQTGENTGNGFAVSNANGIPFWTTFRSMGLQKIGYPASHRFEYKGFTVQVFQKAVLQWNPATNKVQFLNILDELNAAGKDVDLRNGDVVPNHAVLAADAGLDPTTPSGFKQIKNNHLALLNQAPLVQNIFNNEPRWMDLYGLPLSVATIDGVLVVRAQRQVFQCWPQGNAAGLPSNRALMANTGDFTKKYNLFTGDAVTPHNIVHVNNRLASNILVTTNPVLSTSTNPVASLATPIPTVTAAPSTNSISGYGMQAHLLGGNANLATTKIVEAGFNWTKQQVRWSDIETSAGVYNWAAYDDAINTAASRNLKMLVSVVSAPSFRLGPGKSHGPPSNSADIGPFMTELLTRYKGKIHAVEVWNEANLKHEWGVIDNSAYLKYGQMLQSAYTAIKGVDSSVVVLFGAPTPTGVNDPNIGIDDAIYVRRVYESFPTVGNYFDAMGLHPNGGANAPRDTYGGSNNRSVWGWNNHPSFFFNRFEEIRSIMQSKGDGNKNIWFTEFGWSSTPVTEIVAGYEYSQYNSESDQADFLADSFSLIREKYPYVTHMFVWNLNFQAVVGPSDEKYGFGILNPDGTARPAYNKLKSMPKN